MGGSGDGPDDRRRTVVNVPQQGEIWWAEAEDKRRPVLVVTRNEAISGLWSIVVAPPLAFVRR